MGKSLPPPNRWMDAAKRFTALPTIQYADLDFTQQTFVGQLGCARLRLYERTQPNNKNNKFNAFHFSPLDWEFNSEIDGAWKEFMGDSYKTTEICVENINITRNADGDYLFATVQGAQEKRVDRRFERADIDLLEFLHMPGDLPKLFQEFEI
tara:strand:- start:106 stop:561 length:456 start_codon:yes stop_codon:yes gene_type:complete